MFSPLYFIILYFSICGFVKKAGYKLWQGLIPIYNLYLFITVIKVSPILLILISLGLIFLEQRAFFGTLIYIFLPFIIADKYGQNTFIAILTLLFPYVMYPYIAFIKGYYS